MSQRKEQAKHTHGAERAAVRIFSALLSDLSSKLPGTLTTSLAADIISENTHDAEMLEALKAVTERYWQLIERDCDRHDFQACISSLEAVIAKAEGRS